MQPETQNVEEPSRLGARARGLIVVCAAVLVMEALALAGWPLPDPRPFLFVAVAWAAMVGGAGVAAGAVGLSLAYVLFHYQATTRADAVPDWFRAATFLATAWLLAWIVLLLREKSSRTSRSTIGALRERGEVLEGQATRAAADAASRDEVHRAVLDSMPVHVAVLNPDGVVVLVNEAWRRFASANPSPNVPPGAGAPPGPDALGHNYLDVCGRSEGPTAAEAPAVAQGIREVLSGEKATYSLEYPCHAPGEGGQPGELRWFLMTVTPLMLRPGAYDARADSHNPEGPSAPSSVEPRRGAVVSHLDITRRKLSEQSLRRRAIDFAAAARALKRSNEELDQFAYITSHDLRAPLRGIANLSNWIEEDMGDAFTPEAHEQMELLRGRVHRMEAMIDGILEYSRIGRVGAKNEAVDVGRLLAETIDLLDPKPGFIVEVAPDMPTVTVEKLRLQQVFLNLINNAIKHHDRPSGTVRIDCRRLVSGDDGEEAPEAGGYEFSVADDGPGIAPQYHEKVFGIFQTLRPRDQVEGTGVGLALVRKIIEGYGGRIRVESGPGRGSTFRFALHDRKAEDRSKGPPLAPGQAAPEADSADELPDPGHSSSHPLH